MRFSHTAVFTLIDVFLRRLSVDVCVWMCGCVRLYVSCRCVFINTYTYFLICIPLVVNKWIHLCAYIHICIYICSYIRILMYVYTFLYTYVCTTIYVHTDIHIV